MKTNSSDSRYILTLHLSKFVESYAVSNKEETTVAGALVENFILRFGVPKEIVSDKGAEILASNFVQICNLLNINKLNSTAYDHQTLG